MRKHVRNSSGFSLVELVIYIGIVGITAGILTGVLTTVTTTQVEQSTNNEVSGQLNFAMQTIQRIVQESSLIDIPTNTATTTLTLRTKEDGNDPTIISLADGVIYVQQGSGSAQAITDTNNGTINFLEFKKFTQYPGKDIVQIDIAMSSPQQVQGKTVSRSLRSAVSRASAATFDSDLIPGSDNSYSVGLTPSTRWRDGAFAGNLIVGGNVGIGQTTPSYALDITGGIRATASTTFLGSFSVGTSTVDSNRGIVVVGGGWGKHTAAFLNQLGVGLALGATGEATSTASMQAFGLGTGNYLPLLINLNGGNVGIGQDTTDPQAQLEVSGGIRLNTTSQRPTCDSPQRGTLWFTQAGAGDTFSVCIYTSAQGYIWKAL